MRVCFASFGDDATLVARDCVHASDSLPRVVVGVGVLVLVWKVLAELAAGPSLRPNPPRQWQSCAPHLFDRRPPPAGDK